MPLNINNKQVEELAEEVARLTGESKTEAIRKALLERRARLRYRVVSDNRRERLQSFLEREVWKRMPRNQVGRPPGRAERDRILGYGKDGL
jgi:antitoxin VapB